MKVWSGKVDARSRVMRSGTGVGGKNEASGRDLGITEVRVSCPIGRVRDGPREGYGKEQGKKWKRRSDERCVDEGRDEEEEEEEEGEGGRQCLPQNYVAAALN